MEPKYVIMDLKDHNYISDLGWNVNIESAHKFDTKEEAIEVGKDCEDIHFTILEVYSTFKG